MKSRKDEKFFPKHLWDTDLYKSEDFLLNPICILYVVLCTKYTNKICLNQE